MINVFIAKHKYRTGDEEKDEKLTDRPGKI